MQDIQEIFNKVQEVKKKQKEIKSVHRDALKNSAEYQELLDKMDQLKIKKKQIENALKEQFAGELDQLDQYSLELKSDNALLSDAAISKLMKGETVEIIDQYSNKYEPVFSVKFKKM